MLKNKKLDYQGFQPYPWNLFRRSSVAVSAPCCRDETTKNRAVRDANSTVLGIW